MLGGFCKSCKDKRLKNPKKKPNLKERNLAKSFFLFFYVQERPNFTNSLRLNRRG